MNSLKASFHNQRCHFAHNDFVVAGIPEQLIEVRPRYPKEHELEEQVPNFPLQSRTNEH